MVPQALTQTPEGLIYLQKLDYILRTSSDIDLRPIFDSKVDWSVGLLQLLEKGFEVGKDPDEAADDVIEYIQARLIEDEDRGGFRQRPTAPSRKRNKGHPPWFKKGREKADEAYKEYSKKEQAKMMAEEKAKVKAKASYKAKKDKGL